MQSTYQVKARQNKADEFAAKVSPIIQEFVGNDLSLNQIARELNKRDILTARGQIGRWTPTAVKNVIARVRI